MEGEYGIKQFTKEEAIAIAQSEIWKNWTYDEIVRVQLFQEKLCIPFDKLHEAIEKVLERPVWTHEFAFIDKLREEYLGLRDKPSFKEIFELIPEEKRFIIFMKNKNKKEESKEWE